MLNHCCNVTPSSARRASKPSRPPAPPGDALQASLRLVATVKVRWLLQILDVVQKSGLFISIMEVNQLPNNVPNGSGAGLPECDSSMGNALCSKDEHVLILSNHYTTMSQTVFKVFFVFSFQQSCFSGSSYINTMPTQSRSNGMWNVFVQMILHNYCLPSRCACSVTLGPSFFLTSAITRSISA